MTVDELVDRLLLLLVVAEVRGTMVVEAGVIVGRVGCCWRRSVERLYAGCVVNVVVVRLTSVALRAGTVLASPSSLTIEVCGHVKGACGEGKNRGM